MDATILTSSGHTLRPLARLPRPSLQAQKVLDIPEPFFLFPGVICVRASVRGAVVGIV